MSAAWGLVWPLLVALGTLAVLGAVLSVSALAGVVLAVVGAVGFGVALTRPS